MGSHAENVERRSTIEGVLAKVGGVLYGDHMIFHCHPLMHCPYLVQPLVCSKGVHSSAV